MITSAAPARAHEVLPAIADLTVVDGRLLLEVSANLEGFIAGVDLTGVSDTNDAPEAERYDALRALPPGNLAAEFNDFWQLMQDRIRVTADEAPLALRLDDVTVDPVGDVSLSRNSRFSLSATLPEGASIVQVGWDARFGTLVLRQQGVDAPYTGYLEAGALSEPIPLAGGGQVSGWQTFVDYIPVGFDHIVPKGLDHILFVLGLFFLSTRMRPLITQVSLFTLAHTLTLALAALGYVNIPGSIVEPLIAASIVYVAIENIFMARLSRWRPVIVFGFGLLHGLGFASVLGEFGLPDGAFIPALIGFNIGVEVGQLAVIAVMFLCVWQAIRVDRGENEGFQAKALYGVLMLAALALLWLNPEGLATALENPVWVFLGPLLAIFVACFFAVSLVDRQEAYRTFVAIPASVFIACIGAWWFVERVFL